MHILVTRTDAIGDVVLALPLCGYLKEIFPGTRIALLARTYTKPVIDASDAVDEFIDYEAIFALPKEEQIRFLKQFKFDVIIHLVTYPHISRLAKDAGIPMRIGTVSRPYHWITCNRLVWLRRKVSDGHEAALHFHLLRPLGIKKVPENLWQYYQIRNFTALPEKYTALLNTEKFTIILHPKSNGNALEWDLKRFSELINLLETLPEHVIDLTGKLPLAQLITFIHLSDGLVAGSTGPVHLAAATGINTLGLYPKIRPKHGGRWGPIGPKAAFIETETESLDSISAVAVYDRIRSWKKITDRTAMLK
jgi:heptosyltransferase-3